MIAFHHSMRTPKAPQDAGILPNNTVRCHHFDLARSHVHSESYDPITPQPVLCVHGNHLSAKQNKMPVFQR